MFVSEKEVVKMINTASGNWNPLDTNDEALLFIFFYVLSGRRTGVLNV